MRSFFGFRFTVIIALILGSIYVLLPTLLQGDVQARLQGQANTIEAPVVTGSTMEMIFSAQADEVEALATEVRTRLAFAGLDVNKVSTLTEKSGSYVSVRLVAGTGREAIAEQLKAAPHVGFFALESAQATADLVGSSVPALAQVVELSMPSASASLSDGALVWSVTLTEATLPEVIGFSVDGVVRGQVLVEAGLDGTTAQLTIDSLALTEGALTRLQGGLLAGALTLAEAPQQVEAGQPAELAAEDSPSSIPPWLQGLLPDRRLNLGLDLQGGIDLTLQVELEEAILSQATRDVAFLKDAAERDDVLIIDARRDRFEPVLLIETSSELSELNAFFAKSMTNYIYSETRDDKGVARHAYEMRKESQKKVADQSVKQVLETLRKRVNATGVKEPSIVKKGGGRISVQLPGMENLQQAIDAIGTTAVLEFRLVDEEFDEANLERIIAAAEKALPEDQFSDDTILNEWLYDTGRLSENRLILWEYEELPQGNRRQFPYPLKNEIILTGNDVNDAGVSWDQTQQPYVSLEFKPRGARVFCDVTTENVGKRFAIVLDGEVRSAPNIRERICGGQASIEMGMSMDAVGEANILALVLRTGSLNAPVSVGEVRTVGSLLGRDAINAGSVAIVIGSFLVLVFMGFWYRKAGLIANFALALNIVLVLAALSTFGATLTLPGIAGIALTVGMAVDANIIIFERVREELALGQHARKAVEVGFEKGLVAVLDANITTAIAAIVLFSYGTGPIKGFAVTLLIGIGGTLVTALFVTRTLLEFVTRSSTAKFTI